MTGRPLGNFAPLRILKTRVAPSRSVDQDSAIIGSHSAGWERKKPGLSLIGRTFQPMRVS